MITQRRRARRDGAVHAALRNPDIARIEVVWGLSTAGKWAFTILLALYAYAEGGVGAVGLAALARALPAVPAAPFVAALVDRMSRCRALRVSLAVRVAVRGGTAVVVGVDGPLVPVLVLAAVFTVADSAHRPAQAALLPQVARSPLELAASNVIWSVLDNLGFLAGSLLVGVLVVIGDLTGGLVACTAALGAALLLSATIRTDRALPASGNSTGDDGPGPAPVRQGVAAIYRTPALRTLVGVYGADILSQGMLDALLVIAAIELLGLGESGAGWLNAAWAVGGLAGGVAAGALLRRNRLPAGLGVGCLLVGAPLMLIAVVPDPVAALGLLVVLGVGSALIEVALLTLTQRVAPADLLARVYGVREMIDAAATAVGGILAAGLVVTLGVRGALVAVGTVLPLTALLARRRPRGMESGRAVRESSYRLVRELPLFALLPVAMAETLTVRSRSACSSPPSGHTRGAAARRRASPISVPPVEATVTPPHDHRFGA